MLHAALVPGHAHNAFPVDLAHERPTIIGPVMVEPSLRRLSSEAGERILEPKVMQVLVALLREPGEVLSRDDLIDTCWNGLIVGDSSINRALCLLRTALRELAGQAVTIETVPKVGFRLVCGDAGADERPGAMEVSVSQGPLFGRKHSRLAILVVSLLAVIVAAGGWLIQRQPTPQPISVALLSIAVQAPAGEFYAIGLADELRSQLSRTADLRVVAANSARQLQASGLDPLEVGKRLRVDAVIAGALRKEGDDVVLKLSLYGVAEDRATWAREIRVTANEAHLLPDRAAAVLREKLELTLPLEREPDGVSAANYSIYLVAKGMIHSRDWEQIRTAERMLASLTREEPQFAAGWAARAKSVALGRVGNPDPDSRAALAEARRHVARAMRIDPRSAEALAVAGLVADDPNAARKLLERAVEIDPENPEAWLWLSNAYTALGRERDALDALVRLPRIDPLWERSWQASDAAAERGLIEVADRLDRQILNVTNEPWQHDIARARIARRHGDLSGYLRLSGAAAAGAPDARRREINMDRLIVRSYLGLEVSELESSHFWRYCQTVLRDPLPPRRELLSRRIPPESFFRDGTALSMVPFQLVREGREEELLGYFDASFESIDAFVGQSTMIWNMDASTAVPYVMLAMRKHGRIAEAAQIEGRFTKLLVQARKEAASVDRIVAAARFAAVSGRQKEAKILFERARSLGWPNSASLRMPPVLGSLADDPAFASLAGEAWFRKLSAEIDAHRARERREALRVAMF